MLGWRHKQNRQNPEEASPTDGGRLLPVGDNCRELGGYPLPSAVGRAPGATTLSHRFLRSGSTSTLSRKEAHYLREYGVTRVVDLRSTQECASSPDVFASYPGVTYTNVPLFGVNLHDPRLHLPGDTRDYLASGYLRMLDNHEAVRQIFSAFAEAAPEECVLYHCAAGMDRTGITSMLLLGLCGVGRTSIVADYTYSFASREEADAYIYQTPTSTRACLPALPPWTCWLDSWAACTTACSRATARLRHTFSPAASTSPSSRACATTWQSSAGRPTSATKSPGASAPGLHQ